MAKKKPHRLIIEPRPNGFAILRPGAKRASAIEPTQRAAEKRAKQLDPAAGLDVARVKHTKVGTPGRFRKAP